MESLTSLNYLLDGILILIGLLMAREAFSLGLGGAMKRSTRSLVIGAAFLGVAHIVETTVLHYGMEEHANELLHRLIVLVGMFLLFIGLKELLAPFKKSTQSG